MKTKTLFFGILFLVFYACSKDDGPKTPDPIQQPDPIPEDENQAPGIFTLLEQMDGATDIELLPTLTWNTATDPDGDEVSYDVYLGIETDPKTKVASDLTTASFTVVDRLDWSKNYNWKVIAKDGKGGETQSSTINTFKTRSVKLTTMPLDKDFSAGLNHEAIVFKDKIWVVGGYDDNGPTHVVLSSDDAIQWNSMGVPENTNPPFNFKIGPTLSVFKDSLWIIAGTDYVGAAEREVWRGDGTKDQWNFVGNAGFSGRYLHTSIVFQEKIWVLAGLSADDTVWGDLWHSADGETWQEMQAEGAIFSPRFGHSTVFFNDKIWVIGGTNGALEMNDIWFSPDGSSWTEVETTSDNLFEPRAFHDCIVFDDKLWIIGGKNQLNDFNDIWYSENGTDWINATPKGSISLDSEFGSTVVFKDKIYNISAQGFITIFDDPDAIEVD